MPSIASFLIKVAADYPDYTFTPGDHFRWSAHTREIIYDPDDTHAKTHILHELAHALLGHDDYSQDIELIAIERDAWHHAQTLLGPQYNIAIMDSVAQDALDTYRDWLHARSICPNCQATGLQSKKHHYRCIACRQTWRVNDARICGLRRYSINSY